MPTVRYKGDELPVDEAFDTVAADLGAVYDQDDGETHRFTIAAPPGVGRRDVRRGIAAAADTQWKTQSERDFASMKWYLGSGAGMAAVDQLANVPHIPEGFIAEVLLIAGGLTGVSAARSKWSEHRSDRAVEVADAIDVHADTHEQDGWTTYTVEYEEPIRYDLFEPTAQKVRDVYAEVRNAVVGRPTEHDVDVMQVKRGDRFSAAPGEGLLFAATGEYSRDEKEERIEHALDAITDWADDHGYELDVEREMDSRTRPKYVESAAIQAGETAAFPVLEGEVAYEFRSEYPQSRPSVVHARLDFADRHRDPDEQAALQQYVEDGFQEPVGTEIED